MCMICYTNMESFGEATCTSGSLDRLSGAVIPRTTKIIHEGMPKVSESKGKTQMSPLSFRTPPR